MMLSAVGTSEIYNSSKTRYNYYFYFFLFFIWPFGAFLFALYEFEKKEAKLFLALFTALVGYSMIAVSSSLDLYRILNLLPQYSPLSVGDFINRIKHLYSNPDSESVDLYRDIVSFLVSRFTNNGHWLMFVFGLVAGYVYIKILSLFKFDAQQNYLLKYILVLTFSFIIGIDQLAGVRFSLAAYVFFYGTINVIVNRDKRFLFVSALSVLIHFSFLVVVLLLLLFLIMKHFPKLIYILAALSFVLPDSIKSYIFQFSGFFGSAVEARTDLYYNLTSELNYGADTVWFVRYRIILMLIFCYAAMLIINFKKKELKFSIATVDLFLFALLILSFVNFTMNIPHLGYRFQFVFLMFAFFYVYKVYSENSKSLIINNLVLLSVPFSILMIFYGIRSTLYYTPLSLYFFNLPGIFIDHSTQSVWTSLFN